LPATQEKIHNDSLAPSFAVTHAHLPDSAALALESSGSPVAEASSPSSSVAPGVTDAHECTEPASLTESSAVVDLRMELRKAATDLAIGAGSMAMSTFTSSFLHPSGAVFTQNRDHTSASFSGEALEDWEDLDWSFFICAK